MYVKTLLFLVLAVSGFLCVHSINATNISSQQTSILLETTEHKLVEHPYNDTAQAIIRSTQPPEFAKQPSWPNQNYYDEDGPPIKLTCELKSTEGIQMLWYKDGVVIGTRSQIYEFSKRNTTLTIIDPKQDQTGQYRCKATNSAGTIYHSGYILITGREQDTRPHITDVNPSSTILHTDVGHTVNISCTFDVGGTLEALVDLSLDWLMMEDSVNDTDHTTWGIYTDSRNNQVFTLTISNLTHDDYGQYICYGENQRGNTSSSFSVLPPKFKHNGIDMKVVAGCVGGAVVMVILVVMVTYRIKRRKNQQYQHLEWPDIDDRYEVPVRDIEHDVFISYSSEDLTWAKDTLFHNLHEAGYNVCIDFKDFVPGCAVTENIMESIYKSKKTIVILSQSFIKSMWGQFELQQAHNRAIIQRQDILILVRIDDSKVPAQLMGKTFLDWSDPNVNPHFWPRLYDAIGQPGDFKDQSKEEEEPHTDLNIHDLKEDSNIHDATDLNIHDVAEQQIDNQLNEYLNINNETVEENNARNMEYNLEMNFDNT